jgi:hypothetical protein
MPGDVKIKSILARGGIFLNNMRSYGEFKARGNKDSYESLAEKWNQNLAMLKAKAPAEFKVAERLFKINRASSKQPLMTTVYGAGIKGIINSVSDEFVENILKEIETIVNGPGTDAQRSAMLAQLDTELKLLTKGQAVLPSLDVNTIMEAKLDYKGVFALRKWVGDNHGNTVMAAIEQEFGTFMENRTKYNEVINGINEQFVELFTLAVKKERGKLISSLTITKNDDLPIGVHEREQQVLVSIVVGAAEVKRAHAHIIRHFGSRHIRVHRQGLALAARRAQLHR